MTLPFDIFRVETGGVRWLESAATLEDAQALVQKLTANSPAEYLVLNQETGDKVIMTFDGVGGVRVNDANSERPGDAQ
jgi:hypothetical protein